MRRRADRAVAVPLAGLPPGLGAPASDSDPDPQPDAGDGQGDELVTWVRRFDASVLRGRRAIVRELGDALDRIAAHPSGDRETIDAVRKRAAELAGEKGKAGDAANRVIAACVAWEGRPPASAPAKAAKPAAPRRKPKARAKPAAKPRSKPPRAARPPVERHTPPAPPPAPVAPAEPLGEPDGPLLAWDSSSQPEPRPHVAGDLDLLDAALGFGGDLLGLLDTEQAAAIFELSDAPAWLYTTPTCWERVEHASPGAQARMAGVVRERLAEVQQ